MKNIREIIKGLDAPMEMSIQPATALYQVKRHIFKHMPKDAAQLTVGALNEIVHMYLDLERKKIIEAVTELNRSPRTL